MHLERDQFVLTYDAAKTNVDALLGVIRKAGYTARVATDRPPRAAPSSDKYVTLLPELFAQAAREQKPVVMVFHASWCVPCQRLHNETLADPEVAERLRNCLLHEVDADKSSKLAKELGVSGLPDIRLVTPNGSEFKHLRDFQDAELFSDELDNLLASVDPEQPVGRTSQPAQPRADRSVGAETGFRRQQPDSNQTNNRTVALSNISPGGREFKAAFNQGKGLVRVVLLVSPG